MRRFLLVALLFIVCEVSEARGPVQILGVPPRTPTPQDNRSCTRSTCCKWLPAPAKRHECTTDHCGLRGQPGAVPPTANNNALPLRALHTYHRPQGADAGGQRDTNRDSCVWGRRIATETGTLHGSPGPGLAPRSGCQAAEVLASCANRRASAPAAQSGALRRRPVAKSTVTDRHKQRRVPGHTNT